MILTLRTWAAQIRATYVTQHSTLEIAVEFYFPWRHDSNEMTPTKESDEITSFSSNSAVRFSMKNRLSFTTSGWYCVGDVWNCFVLHQTAFYVTFLFTRSLQCYDIMLLQLQPGVCPPTVWCKHECVCLLFWGEMLISCLQILQFSTKMCWDERQRLLLHSPSVPPTVLMKNYSSSEQSDKGISLTDWPASSQSIVISYHHSTIQRF